MGPGTAMLDINWFAVLLAAVVSFVIGGLWYGPLFGKQWLRASGVDEAALGTGGMGRIFALSFLMQLLAAAVLALFIGAESTLTFGLFAGVAAGVFWVATAFGVVYLFERRPFAHWAVNASYHIVVYAVMGAILGAWS